MSETLADQPWLTASSTRAVIAALEAAGGKGCARFVGGAVRNAIMRQPVDDVDIATPLTPQAVVAALDAAGLKHAPTGLAHGTVTAIAERTPFEITTLRRDVSTDGRNATVAFTDDWAEDAQRRDFRFNALYADGDGTIYDPTGEGLADAHAGRVVFVGDPETRIREDYLRILRFFRFHAWYGRGEADWAALEACSGLKDGMSRLSAERVAKELLKLLAAPEPVGAVGLMETAGILAVILPEARAGHHLAGMVAVDEDPLLRLAALVRGEAEAVAKRLRLSNAQRERLVAALAQGPEVEASMSEPAARRVLYAIGRQAFHDRLKLAQAAGGASPDGLLSTFEGWVKPVLPVGGKDALALGAAPGPKVSQALREVEAWWIGQDFPDDKDAAMSVLQRALG